ncbi:MAG: sodium/proline symporter [Clostridiales bacterium]|nr:sodium/proline symporter [Clostridiales bacterium]
MGVNSFEIFIVMALYMAIVIGIGLFYAKRANANSENFFLGGRSLGPWVTAMSAEASDMSGWLLMGLPGLAYWSGLADAFWTAIGLLAGTYINWKLVAKRLHGYSVINGSITIPDFLSSRYKETKKYIMVIAAVFILAFFTVYAASCFVTVGKLFSRLFGYSYVSMMVLGAIFVVLYTFLGGFLAESVSDTMQGIVMITVLVFVLGAATKGGGGPSNVVDNIKDFPGFLEFFTSASPELSEGRQAVSSSLSPLFGMPKEYGFLAVISTLSWGLGYFGVPQVLLRFMAIRKNFELTQSRRIATVWCAISLFAAVSIGLIGRALYPVDLLTASEAESIFIIMATNLLPTVLAGVAMAGILAATISSSDSYLLIASSAVAKNIFQGVFKKEATDKEVMKVTRITLVIISLIGVFIALDENSIIFAIVSFAWAGFGATFGPIVLFSLFWKRTTRQGAVAGMLVGGITVFVWNLLIKPVGGVFGIYELLPAFILSCIAIVVVSLMTKEPSKIIQEEFEAAKNYID